MYSDVIIQINTLSIARYIYMCIAQMGGQNKIKRGVHNPGFANSILILCHCVFTDQFIYGRGLGYDFQQKCKFRTA